MRNPIKIVVIVIITIVCGLVALLVFPPLEPATYAYFDPHSGQIKFEKRIVGLTYKTRINQTSYSDLLKLNSMASNREEWRITSVTRTGILGKNYADYEFGKIAADANQIAAHFLIDGGTNNLETLQNIRRLQKLIGDNDSETIRKWLVEIYAPKNGVKP